MELVSTMEINGEEREIADAYARGQIDASNVATVSGMSYSTEADEINIYAKMEPNATVADRVSWHDDALNGVFDTMTAVKQNINSNIDGINSNLNQIEFGEVAGGKNIAHDIEYKSQTEAWKYIAIGYAKLIQDIEYTMSFTVTSNGSGKIYIPSSSGFESGNPVININSGTTRITRTAHAIGNDGITKSVFVSTYEGNSSTISITDFMIEEGATATDYEPYIPSVKMLADEVSAQNESLDALEFGEVAGGKNLLKTNNVSITSAGNFINEEIFLNAGSYIFQFIPSVSCACQIQAFDSNNNVIYDSKGFTVNANQSRKKEIIINSNSARIEVYTNSSTGGTFSNIMLESGTELHDYEPYIMSNKQLTENVDDLKNDLGGLSFSVSGTTLSITDGTNTWTLSN